MTDSATASCPYCNHEFASESNDARDCPECGRTVIPASDVHTGRLEAWIPVQLGDFRVETSIGHGGMGRLFKGENGPTGECVAIKCPLAGQESDERTLSRFEREIGILKSLDHPNVVRFLASGEEAGFRYYVMEWVDGDDLKKVISDCRSEGKSLPFEFVHKCLGQLCFALQALHNAGVIHRDVKPSNIMVMADGVVKLVDLGVAKLQKAEATLATRTMGLAGTYEYAAPEQLSDPQNVDHRADIFSLGMVIYEMLTGIVARGNIKPASLLNSTAPECLDRSLMQMLEANPVDRPHLSNIQLTLVNMTFRHPWPPALIMWCTLACSLAAGLPGLLFGLATTLVNWARLGAAKRMWRPFLIGVAAVLLFSTKQWMPLSGLLWLDLSMYFSFGRIIAILGCGVLVFVDLQPQQRAYTALRDAGCQREGWFGLVSWGTGLVATSIYAMILLGLPMAGDHLCPRYWHRGV